MNISGFTLASDIPEKPVEWLWGGYIPLGELTILEGYPDTNKSSLTIDLAARLTRKQLMPCIDSHQSQPSEGGAVFLIGEDSPSKTVRGRLLAAGANLSKVGILEHLVVPQNLLTLEKAILAVDAKLVVVDGINDFVNCNLLSNQQVRKALQPLRELADRHNLAVVALRHFVKSRGSHSLLRGGGSVGITAVCRSQLKLYKHPDDPDMRVLLHDKSNLGPLSPSLAFEVVPVNGSIRLEWHGQTSLTLEELDQKSKAHPKLDAAEKFLLDQLHDGQKEVNWLIDEAKGVCGKRTLDEAKRSLGVKTIRKGRGRDHKVYWSL